MLELEELTERVFFQSGVFCIMMCFFGIGCVSFWNRVFFLSKGCVFLQGVIFLWSACQHGVFPQGVLLLRMCVLFNGACFVFFNRLCLFFNQVFLSVDFFDWCFFYGVFF